MGGPMLDPPPGVIVNNYPDQPAPPRNVQRSNVTKRPKAAPIEEVDSENSDVKVERKRQVKDKQKKQAKKDKKEKAKIKKEKTGVKKEKGGTAQGAKKQEAKEEGEEDEDPLMAAAISAQQAAKVETEDDKDLDKEVQ